MNPTHTFTDLRPQRGLIFGVIIVTALLAFEIFNYSTTDYALADLLGDLKFFGVRWSTILAIAFCGIDFAGIARLFSPVEHEPGTSMLQNESWYLFGAWLLAATMNAGLTWWGVSLAVLGHETLGNEVVGRAALVRIVPLFVAVLVWLIRVLIIGTFSVAGERLFNPDAPQAYTNRPRSYSQPQLPAVSRPQAMPRSAAAPAALKSPSANNGVRQPAPRAVAAAPANPGNNARQAPISAAPRIPARVAQTQPVSYYEEDDGERNEPSYHSVNPRQPAPYNNGRTNPGQTRQVSVRPSAYK